MDLRAASFVFLLVLAGCVSAPKPLPLAPSKPIVSDIVHLTPVRFADLPGWSSGDPAAAFNAFRRSCAVLLAQSPGQAMGAYAGTIGDWIAACRAIPDATSPRKFFEEKFTPLQVGTDGLFTGYYEPELRASRTRHGAFQTPVYGVPADLVTVDLGAFRPEWKGQHLTARLANQKLTPYPGRASIDRVPPPAKILFWCDDPIAVFFLQIQGSGRARFEDGSITRIAYAAQNGQSYTAIGATLIARGELTRENVSLQSIRAWLIAHPGEAQGVMESDASFVFFKEEPLGDPSIGAVGAANLALTPNGSLAVDPHEHPFGMPLYVAALNASDGYRINALYIAQDTGGAIKGAVRGDIFFGFGPEAEAHAGTLKARGALYVLLPKALAARIGSVS